MTVRIKAVGIFFAVLMLSCYCSSAHAILINIADPSYVHFGDFPHVNSPGDYSNISNPYNTDELDFGWHYSPSNHGEAIGGIIVGETTYSVTQLELQVHGNPFKNFLLQGSYDTTTGLDGGWDTLLTSTVTERTEKATQGWEFSNENPYSSYRIKVLSDYTPEGQGWAMHRWQLLADDQFVGKPQYPQSNNQAETPEPATLVLLGVGLLGSAIRRRYVL